MTSLTYNRLPVTQETYKARQAALLKATNTDTIEEAARCLSRTVTMNGREVMVSLKRNFKKAMVK